MKILALHTDYVNFKPLKKALKSVDDLSKEDQKEKKVKDALMIMTAVESHDNPVGIVQNLVNEIKNIAKQVGIVEKTGNVVLYPYAHLSSNLASPDIASKVLVDAEKELEKIFKKVVRAPFGYYKEFELKVKGHPLSELSREIGEKSSGSAIDVKNKNDGKVLNKLSNSVSKNEVIDSSRLLNDISKSKLDRRKLKENDHRIIGQEMDLFSFNDVAPGMVFWHNNGLIIYNELISYLRELLREKEYTEIKTPEVLDKRLWLISGHWEKYKENIFLSGYEGREFAVKPMNCPGGMMIYRSAPKSYRDLPLRAAEFGTVHRQELSGVLAGLFRVIQFTQDDAHVFCTEEQMEDEIKRAIEFMREVYSQFGFSYAIELSTRPEKRIGSNEMWDKAEKALETVLKRNKITYKLNPGDGAFYGPKIDFHLKDSLGRTWQCGTIQLDFSMPERFELEYVDKDNSKKRPIMLHRAIFGSLERFIGILLENTNGRLQTWLSPVQVRVLSFTDRNSGAVDKVVEQLKKAIPSLRIDKDTRSETMAFKVKEAEVLRVPYIVTIGDKEEKENNLAIRVRGSNKLEKQSPKDFIDRIKKEIEERK